MNDQIEQIKQFTGNFMDQILIPLAEAGLLNEEMINEAVSIYASELTNRSVDPEIIITLDGPYQALHPHFVTNFEHNGKSWPTLEHFFQAAKYLGTDDKIAESIRTSPTVELAVRKVLNAAKTKTLIRPGWNGLKEQEFELAIKSMFKAHPKSLELLKQTEKNVIIYRVNAIKEIDSNELTANATDLYFGLVFDESQKRKGENTYGKILTRIRDN